MNIKTKEGNEWEFEVMDSTHFRFRLAGQSHPMTVLHIAQMSDDMNDAVESNGLLDERGLFFKISEGG